MLFDATQDFQACADCAITDQHNTKDINNYISDTYD